MRVLLVLSTMVLVASFASAAGVCTKTVAHDWWVNADTGQRIGPADPSGNPPDEAIAHVVVAGSCKPRRMAIALREVVAELWDRDEKVEVVKVLRTYFVAVPVAEDGTPALKVSANGELYFDFRKVQRCVQWDAASGGTIKGWKLGR